MKIYQQLLNRNNEKFANAKVEGTRDIAPRPGFYFVKDITFRPILPFGEVPIANVIWKANEDSFFLEEETTEIALSNLYSANPSETANLNHTDLIGRTIRVYNVMFVNKWFNGVERKVLNCTWSFAQCEPIFVNPKNAGLAVFFGSASTLPEACKNFSENAPYDIADAEFWDANRKDTTVEDPNEDTNDYIEKTGDDYGTDNDLSTEQY